MKDFEFQAAGTVDEAVSLLAARGERAKVLAGGTDILVQLREGLREADLVVDVKKIPELMKLDYSPAGGLKLGAGVPCYRIYDECGSRRRPIRRWPTRPGSSAAGRFRAGRASAATCATRRPRPTSIPSLIAYDVTCHLAGPQGRRSVPVAEFCTAPGKNVLARGEMLATLEFPPRGTAQRRAPTCGSFRATRWTSPWSARPRGCSSTPRETRSKQARMALAAVAPTPLAAKEAASGWPASRRPKRRLPRPAKLAEQGGHARSATCAARPNIACTWSACSSKRTLAIAVARAQGKPTIRALQRHSTNSRAISH